MCNWGLSELPVVAVSLPGFILLHVYIHLVCKCMNACTDVDVPRFVNVMSGNSYANWAGLTIHDN